jgi:hypothetical protein
MMLLLPGRPGLMKQRLPPPGRLPGACRAPVTRGVPAAKCPPPTCHPTATNPTPAAPQVHTMRAEEFLEKTVQFPKYAGGAFDQGQLLHPGSIMFVEYPKQLKHQVPDTLGALEVVRGRNYGRTCVAVYAAPETQL